MSTRRTPAKGVLRPVWKAKQVRFFQTPRYRDEQELLDVADEASESELAHTLRDIRRANIFGMGTWVVLTHLEQLLWERPPDGKVEVLDLATGSADIPQAVCKWGSAHGYRIRFVATDISEEILSFARARILKAGLESQVDFTVCDASTIPFADRSFDFVTCSLALHHLNVEQARTTLREMERLSRRGFIVNDIYRSQGAWYMAWALSRLTTTNRLTRHDGPASVYRAFTPLEASRLGREAGVSVEVHKHPFWRMAVIGRREQRA